MFCPKKKNEEIEKEVLNEEFETIKIQLFKLSSFKTGASDEIEKLKNMYKNILIFLKNQNVSFEKKLNLIFKIPLLHLVANQKIEEVKNLKLKVGA